MWVVSFFLGKLLIIIDVWCGITCSVNIKRHALPLQLLKIIYIYIYIYISFGDNIPLSECTFSSLLSSNAKWFLHIVWVTHYNTQFDFLLDVVRYTFFIPFTPPLAQKGQTREWNDSLYDSHFLTEALDKQMRHLIILYGYNHVGGAVVFSTIAWYCQYVIADMYSCHLPPYT